MTPSLGIEPGPHWWEASALTTAPSLRGGKRELSHQPQVLEYRNCVTTNFNFCEIPCQSCVFYIIVFLPKGFYLVLDFQKYHDNGAPKVHARGTVVKKIGTLRSTTATSTKTSPQNRTLLQYKALAIISSRSRRTMWAKYPKK